MPNQKPRVRFAPSPTGQLHVGNARTALYNWLFARHHGGDFLLRIEDTDVERSELRYEEQLMDDLRWLGLNWTEGPGVGGPHGPYRQSERLDIYRQYTDRLLFEGKAYRCFCTSEELDRERAQAVAEHKPQIYSGKCRNLDAETGKQRAAAGEPCAIRLQIPDAPLRFHDMVRGDVEFASDTVSDPILVRSSGVPVYNYVVTVDDALMEITHVIRGDDHISNTPKQVAIYQAFGWPVPEFAHLSTILGADRERLSKRHGATSISSFREMGILPEALTNYLALLGWGAEDGKTETFTLDELTREFKLERVTSSPAIFDFDKLHWLNRHYLKLAEPKDIRDLAWPYFAARNLLPPQGRDPVGTSDHNSLEKLPVADNIFVAAWFSELIKLFLPSVDTLAELPQKAALIFCFDPAASRADPENAALLSTESARKVLHAFATRVRNTTVSTTPEQFKIWMNEIKAETGVRGKELFHPVRIALTGAYSGPEFDKLIPLIEEGSRLSLPTPIPSIRQRIDSFVTEV